MMELKEKKLNFMQIWNSVQVYAGQTVAMQTGDLYILDHCLKRMAEISHEPTKQVFKNLLHVWDFRQLRALAIAGYSGCMFLPLAQNVPGQYPLFLRSAFPGAFWQKGSCTRQS